MALAIPVVLNMLMEFALQTTDYFWVGKLGPAAQDAVTSSMVVIWTIFVLISIVYVGTNALIARFVGSGDYKQAGYYLNQGLSLAVIISLIVSLVGYLITPLLLTFMDTQEDTLLLAQPYLRIFFLSTLFFFLNDTSFAGFRASGDTKTPTIIGISVVILNLILDPIFIFGVGPIPSFGVKGASIATTISVIVGTGLVISRLLKKKINVDTTNLFKIQPRIKEMYRIAKIGLPVSTQQIIFVVVYWFIIKIVHDFGQNAGAAMGIGNRMESFAYLTCFGFSVAASTMVGQNLGAGKPDRAAKCAWGSIWIAIGYTAIMSLIFIVFPEYIVSIFTDSPEVSTIAVDYLIILGISQSAMAVEIVLEGAFGGAGDTIPPMVVGIPGSIARIPLAYWLVYELGWGINGIWWTLTITTFVKSLALAIWFYKGNWKKKEV